GLCGVSEGHARFVDSLARHRDRALRPRQQRPDGGGDAMTTTRSDAPPSDAEAWAARVSRITAEDLAALLDPTDHTMALFFERFYAVCLHTSPQYGAKSWSGHVWEDD